MNAIKENRSYTKPQIVIKKVYQFEISALWEALTNKEALSEWLMETKDFVLEDNAEFRFTTKPQGGFDGIVHCKMLSFDEPNHISYEWRSNKMKQATIVSWNLKRISSSETLLTLSHNGFIGFDGWFTKLILSRGWKGMLSKKLNQYLQK